MVSMTSQNESTADLLESKERSVEEASAREDLFLASSSSHHFGQLVWAKLASAPFWPAVIFTEENQDWIRHKGSRRLSTSVALTLPCLTRQVDLRSRVLFRRDSRTELDSNDTNSSVRRGREIRSTAFEVATKGQTMRSELIDQ